MELKVKLDKEAQKARQSEVWGALASTLPPAPKKTLIRLIIAVALIAVAIAIFIAIAVNGTESSMTVLGVILLIAGAATLSGSLFDFFAKRRKRKKIMRQLNETLDEMFRETSAATDATFDFGDTGVTVTFSSDDGNTVRRFAQKLTECAVTAVNDKLAVDFNDTDSYCFTEEEIGKDRMLRLKRGLLARHESYRTIDRDERGRYYISGNDG